MYEIIGSLIGIVALYHLFGCGNPVTLFSPGSATGKQSQQANQVQDQTRQVSQEAQGQTKAQEEDARVQIQPLIDRLVQQGLAADQAQVIQQAITNLSGQDLVQANEHLKGLGDQVEQGLIKPGDLSTMGGIIATAVQKQYQTGQGFNFGNAMTEISAGLKAQMPQLQATADQAAGAANKISEQTGALGTLDQQKFNERMQPALQTLNQQYTNDSRTMSEQMDARGLQEQGSFAGTGTDNTGEFKVNPRITSESSPENHARLMLAQQHDKDLAAATLQAQGQAEGQQVSELNAAQQTPGALKGAVEAQASPFAALSQQTQAEGNTNLALQSSRAADTKSLADTGTGAVNTQVAGQAGKTGAEQGILATDVARTEQTYPKALAQESVPQSERLGYGAGVTPGVTGAFSSLGNNAMNNVQANQKQGAGAFMSLVGSGMTMAGGKPV